MTGINFDLPVWLLALCVLGGLLYAIGLYYRNKQFDGKNKLLQPLLGFLRFVLASTLLALLLNPFLKSLINEVKDPVIAIIQDDSQSVGKWLEDNPSDYLNDLENLGRNLSENYQIDHYTLGSQLRERKLSDTLSFSEELTNLETIKALIDEYEGANLGALILATDGLYNQGKNPIYSGLPRHIPLYGLALGDTAKRKDALIKNVYHNDIAYLNDIIAILFDIKANNCQGSLAKLIVEQETDGAYKKIQESDISIRTKDFFTTLESQIELTKPGITHYRARLTGIRGEEIRANNVRDIFIEVLDARQKIRILAQGPHPDVAALRSLLLANKNYGVELEYMADQPDPLAQCDMTIFHNLPSTKYSINAFVERLDQRRTPQLFVVGSGTNLVALNAIQDMLEIKGSTGSVNEVQAILLNDFSLFTLSDALKNYLPNFPPLLAPFGEYKLNPSSTVLLNQKIGNIETDYPLLVYQNKAGMRSAMICGEGIWKWKLFDYLEKENFEVIKELISKTITYASVKEDKRKFRVSSQQRLYNENEDILFIAELYNDNYELVNEGEVFFAMNNDANEEFNYTFSKKDNYYTLDIGSLAPGKYTYAATTIHNGNQLNDAGSISVQEIQYELYDLEAKHSLLYALADMQNGKVYSPSNMSEIVEEFNANGKMKPVLYQYAQNKSVIDFKWLFFVLLGLLGMEWFLRRYNGSL